MIETTDEIRAGLAPTGALRAAINFGNPVLAQGDARAPRGVTVELALALGDALAVPADLVCATAAKDSFAALTSGRADLAFLAVEPARAAEVTFTRPYVAIEGVYAVPLGSPITSPEQVDRVGVRVGVKEGSAYDLFLSRTLSRATVVRGREGLDVLLDQGLEVGAGIRQPVEAVVAARSEDLRVIPDAFMQIRQAVAVGKGQPAEVAVWVDAVVAQCLADGLIARWLADSGQDPALALTNP